MTVTARMRFGVLAALMGATLTACGDDDGMSPGIFDPEVTAAAMGDMVAAGDDMEEAWVGMSLAGSLFESESAAALLPGSGILLDPASTLGYANGLESVAFFPSNYLGVTFVWSQGQQAYVPSEEAGAPEDGIRVVYYDVNASGTAPRMPLTVLGYIDLRDLSTASSDRLGVKVEHTASEAPVTLADYFIDLSYSVASESITVEQVSEGYLSNGTDRLDFDLSNEATLSDNELVIDQAYVMSLAGTDIRVSYEGTVAGDWDGESVTVSLNATVAGEGTSVRFEVDAADGLVTGSVYHGNDLVATLSGTPEAPVFTNAATGEELTPAQLEALADVFHAVERLFELASGIFGITGG